MDLITASSSTSNQRQSLPSWKIFVFQVFTVLSYANSAVNPFLYAFTNEHFRPSCQSCHRRCQRRMTRMSSSGRGRRGSSMTGQRRSTFQMTARSIIFFARRVTTTTTAMEQVADHHHHHHHRTLDLEVVFDTRRGSQCTVRMATLAGAAIKRQSV